MLGGSSSRLGSSGPKYTTPVSAHDEAIMSINNNNNSASLFEDEQDRGDRNSAGNRWPRQETLALLKIRSDMDAVFRDSSLKGPLWDDISRKMAELGFNRSSKKCKEKFENVYKYHRRTKDCRATKQDGKSYRFFDQLEALDQYHNSTSSSSLPPLPAVAVVSTTMAKPVAVTSSSIHVTSTVPLTTNPTPPFANNFLSFASVAAPTQPIPVTRLISCAEQSQIPKVQQANLMSNSLTSSSSTSSDEEFVEEGRTKRKRKWKDFLERLMNQVIEKQEKLQKKFLDAIEKREHDRIVREESWKMQEVERMNREHEILVKERSMAAAKDAAVITFLQKVSEQQNPTQSQPQPPQPQSQSQKQQQHQQHQQQQQQEQQRPASPAPPPLQPPLPQVKQAKEILKSENGGKTASPSRWPKTEVQALINLRTNLDLKYHENGPKGLLWEDVSAGMAKNGYNRSAKRCKEKWENINKYFKKVKESNKRRTEDSKTCPYFHLLDALYKERNKLDPPLLLPPNYEHQTQMAPLMVQPEHQWPPQQDLQQKRPLDRSVGMEYNVNKTENDDDDEDDYNDEDNEDDYNDEDNEDGGGSSGGYEIVSNKPANYNTVGKVE